MASQERTKALARRVSGRPKFKEAERTMQQAQTLARDRKTEASARAYFDAADLFASAAAGAAAVAALRGPKKKRRFRQRPNPSLLPRLRRRNPIRRPAHPKMTRAAVDPVIDGFASAMSRGDRGALLAAYPNPPAGDAGRSRQAASRLQPAHRQQVHGQRFARPARGGVECGERRSSWRRALGKRTSNGSVLRWIRRRLLADHRQSLTRAADSIRRHACGGLRSGRAGQRRPLSFLLVAVSRDPDQGSARHPAR